MTDLNNVTNELLNEYAAKFNENYNDIVQLNSTIQNKEELIIRTQEVILYKERNIIILTYLLYFSVVVFLLTAIYSSGKVPGLTAIFLAVAIFIILGIACYLEIAKHFSYLSINTKLRSLKVSMSNYLKKLAKTQIPPYECPSQCTTDEDDDDGDNSDDKGNFKYNNTGSSLKIDPSLNVWKYGDVPIGSDLNFANELLDEESPQPFFGESSPQTVYYECKWLGNNSEGNMPKRMRTNRKQYSTIPCSYRPNNSEINRWFCQKDPNDLDDKQKKQFCQKAN